MKRPTQTVASPLELPREVEPDSSTIDLQDARPREDSVEWLWLPWDRRKFLAKATL